MNIQIFARNKCFDSKKAERFFKERGIKFQRIDLDRYGMSAGELRSCASALGGLKNLVNETADGAEMLNYLAYDSDREQKLLDDPRLIKTPVVRNGKKATLGFCPDIWKKWIAEDGK